MTEDHWLTVREASERLRVNADTVRRWLRAGQLHGQRIGGRAGWRVTETEVQRFIREGKRAESGQVTE